MNSDNSLLFGENTEEGLVAVDLKEGGKGDSMVLFFRDGDSIDTRTEPFRPFIIVDRGFAGDIPGKIDATELEGGGVLSVRVDFSRWKDCVSAKSWLAKATGFSASAPGAPYLFINDPVQQHLTVSGHTLFKGMGFSSLRRLQLDIECTTTEGYEFCNAEREGDRIIAIALADRDGWLEVLSGVEMEEKEMLERFAELVRERDPDVIEGHNIFNFDLPYLARRAKMHKVKLSLGRDGSVPRARPSRFSAGERTISYTRYDIFGRHVADTLFMVHAYDISHRSLGGFGLKEVAVHFGLAAKSRTYIDGPDIAEQFRKSPGKVMKYVRDDVLETRGIGSLLSQSYFVQAQMLPYSYQNVSVRGNATKINALMIREYLRQGHALPLPEQPREFAGGYTDLFREGVIENVHHCDVRSLYPSLMLTMKMGPGRDELNVFLGMLEILRDFRLDAKRKMAESADDAGKNHYEALQAAFKVLINSFYGYLGFAQGNFNDYGVAEQVTAEGRKLLKNMIKWVRRNGAEPIEIDTDGIYFVPPEQSKVSSKQSSVSSGKMLDGFREAFQASLPEGIEVEFDGEYKSMYSYKMKNYALLDHDGEMIIKGGALKSRGLEPFQREFLEEIIRLKLEGKTGEIPELKQKYEKAINDRAWPIEKMAKTETLQDSPATYAAKREKGKTPARATYELALRSGRDYRAGDQVSYYVTGDKKSVKVHESAKLVSAWDPKKRDENVPYYLGKLEALYKKFGRDSDDNAELDLGC